MSSYWGSDGQLVDGRFELTGSNVLDGQTLWTPGMLHNGTTNDKPRGNMEGTLLASAARTATTVSALQTNHNAKGVMLYLNITVASGTGGLRLTIHGRDIISSSDVQLNVTPTPITATGIYTYELYPGSTAAGVAGSFAVNQRSASVLPRTWRAIVNAADATSYTYSLGYSTIV